MVIRLGEGKWCMIAKSLPGRIGKQCRERWINHLNPNIKVKFLCFLFLSLLTCKACLVQFLAAFKPGTRKKHPKMRCVHCVSPHHTCIRKAILELCDAWCSPDLVFAQMCHAIVICRNNMDIIHLILVDYLIYRIFKEFPMSFIHGQCWMFYLIILKEKNYKKGIVLVEHAFWFW